MNLLLLTVGENHYFQVVCSTQTPVIKNGASSHEKYALDYRINLILKFCHNHVVGIYLRIIALCYLYGATVHYANLLGFGEMTWAKAPLS